MRTHAYTLTCGGRGETETDALVLAAPRPAEDAEVRPTPSVFSFLFPKIGNLGGTPEIEHNYV
jgi:hypothetical protein